MPTVAPEPHTAALDRTRKPAISQRTRAVRHRRPRLIVGRSASSVSQPSEVVDMAAQAFTDTARGVAYPRLATGAQATRALRGLKVREAARQAAIAGLVATMAIGSVALWTVVPAGVLWLVSRLSASSDHLTLGICLAVAVAVPTAIALGGQALVRVERVYMRMTDTAATARVVPGWRRSLSDSDELGPASVLEKLMVASVLLALVALATWFVAFTG
jgi:hypothetical protein